MKLPCGAKGRVPFFIVPEGIQDWFMEYDITPVADNQAPLGDCCKKDVVTLSRYYSQVTPRCGLVKSVSEQNIAAFGRGTEDIHKALPKPVSNRVIYGGWKSQTPTTELPGYASTVDPQEDKGWDNFDRWVKCDNCGFYEMPEDMEAYGAAILCKDCIPIFEPELEPIIAGSPYEEDVEWQGREAQLLVKEYGG